MLSPRLHSTLLCLALLAALGGCGTPSSRTTAGPAAEQDAQAPSPADAGPSQRRFGDWQGRPLGQLLEQVAALSKRAPAQPVETALDVLGLLEPVASGQLVALAEGQAAGDGLAAWFELALQVRGALVSGIPLHAAARAWADAHPQHPVGQAVFAEAASRYGARFPAPSKVAILLPAAGGLAAAGDTVRDGIVSAYLERPGGSSIRFYPSGDTAESAVSAYLQAVEDGATQVIGPLHTEGTRALSRFAGLGTPLLLLNEPEDGVRAEGVNSLALSQTAEATSIAGNALARGQKRALVMVADNAWGRRVETAFTAAFEQGEGEVAAATRFNTAISDHSVMLTQLLRITDSIQRKKDLQSLLGVTLDFEPTHREDFDFIFMAADPQQGRELKPLLRFHDAGDVPVYAMGRVFSGKVERARDQDLNGVVFPITPWQLGAGRQPRPLRGGAREGAFGNLYALGLDAWRVLPWLPLLQADPDLWYAGQVGALRLEADGRFLREPAWAEFSAGQPVPYRWPLAGR